MTDQMQKSHVSKKWTRSDTEVEYLFKSHLAIWNDETEMLSTSRVITHPSYLAIIGLGRQVLPLILKDMSTGGGPWFAALRALIDDAEYPVKQEHKTSARMMTQDWLDWGKANGLIA